MRTDSTPTRATSPRRRIAVTGASGFIGAPLIARLEAGGHEVLRLVRRAPRGPREVQWDPARGEVDRAALVGLDAVVHLAGEPVAGLRWTAARRARIVGSRVGGSRALVDALRALATPPRVVVAASAVGWYGDRGDEVLTEDSPRGAGFLADSCAAWERETARAADIARVVQLRFGVVLDPAGGALRAMLPVFRAGLGGPLAGGRMWLPWIALADALAAVLFALATESLSGPVNVTAPGEARQGEFARTLGRVLRRPAFLPAPRFAVRALLGRGQADELLLASARVRPARLAGAGFAFESPTLRPALEHALGR